MTVKELIAALNALPSDATVTYTYDRFIVSEVNYDELDNAVTFAGTREFGVEYEDDLIDVEDDVDESFYNPYLGCDEYETTDFFNDD